MGGHIHTELNFHRSKKFIFSIWFFDPLFLSAVILQSYIAKFANPGLNNCVCEIPVYIQFTLSEVLSTFYIP